MESLQQIQFEELEAKRTFASAELQAGANANSWHQAAGSTKAGTVKSRLPI